MTMTRRGFLSASAAFASAPLLGGRAWGAPLPREADIVVIGAGAAGIAAARRIMAANRKVVVIEAANQIGGRCITDNSSFDVPFDRGARWMHNPDANPMLKLARGVGLEIATAPSGQKIRIGRRNARAGETEEFLATLVRTNRAIDETSRKFDASCAAALPKDLGDWASTIEFTLGASFAGKDLKDFSSVDKVRAQDRNVVFACRQGMGTLIAKLAEEIPVALSTPATRLDWGNRDVTVDTPSGGSPRAPPSSRCRPTCWRPATSNTRPKFPSASSMRPQSSASAATITSRCNCPAIRSGLRATTS